MLRQDGRATARGRSAAAETFPGYHSVKPEYMLWFALGNKGKVFTLIANKEHVKYRLFLYFYGG